MYYILSFKKLINPEILIDITDVYEDKVKALNAHESQIDVFTTLRSNLQSIRSNEREKICRRL